MFNDDMRHPRPGARDELTLRARAAMMTLLLSLLLRHPLIVVWMRVCVTFHSSHFIRSVQLSYLNFASTLKRRICVYMRSSNLSPKMWRPNAVQTTNCSIKISFRRTYSPIRPECTAHSISGNELVNYLRGWMIDSAHTFLAQSKCRASVWQSDAKCKENEVSRWRQFRTLAKLFGCPRPHCCTTPSKWISFRINDQIQFWR